MKLVVSDKAVANVLLLSFDPVLDGKAPQIAHWINARAVVEAVLLSVGATEIGHTAVFDATVAEWKRLRSAEDARVRTMLETPVALGR